MSTKAGVSAFQNVRDTVGSLNRNKRIEWECIGQGWIGLDRDGMDWIGLDWIGFEV